jgi:hypothetical protein
MSSRLNRVSLSPDPSTPPLIGVPPVYKSGLVLHQQERNSPSFQSYKQLNHDYVNTNYILHSSSGGSSRVQSQGPKTSVPFKGLVQKRSAEFEAFLQGTLEGGTTPRRGQNLDNHNTVQNKSMPNLLLVAGGGGQQQPRRKSESPLQILQPKAILPQQPVSPFHQPPQQRNSPFQQVKPASPFQQSNPASPFQHVCFIY